MKIYEEYARLKSNEAIQQGLASQRYHPRTHRSDRDPGRSPANGKRYLLVFLTLALGLALAGAFVSQVIF
jgi:hypothetical protein